MDNHIVEYIREQLAAKENVQTILASLKNAGHSEEVINSAFQQAMQVPQPPQTGQITSEIIKAPQSDKGILDLNSINATKALILIGVLLIITAAAIVLVSQWGNVGPITRVAFLAIPMFLLFGLAFYLKDGEHKANAETLLATGGLFLPFTVGTFLYQFEIISEFDSLLFLVSSVSAYILYTAFEFLDHRPKFAPLSLISLGAVVMSIVMQFKLDSLAILWVLWGVALCVALFGLYLIKQKNESGDSYTGLGLATAILLFPWAILSTIASYLEISSTSYVMLISAFGIMYLGLAMYLHQLYKATSNHAIYNVKRLIEELAIIGIVAPYILYGFENVFFMLVGILISFGAIFASIKIKIRTFLPVGTTGIVIGILTITGQYFIDSLGWPIVIFISGFAMIGLSFLVRNIHQHRIHMSEDDVFGLGATEVSEGAMSSIARRGHTSWGRIILLLIVLGFVLPYIINIILYIPARLNY